MISQDLENPAYLDSKKPEILLTDKEDEIKKQREELNREKRKSVLLTLFLIILVLFLLLGLVYSVYLVSERTRISSKAESSSLTRKMELANSYLFASPLKAKVASGERIRITIFILDSQGLGVGGKMVVLGKSDNLEVDEVQPITDDVGKAIFEVSSSVAGVYSIEASVDGKVLPQRVTVTFEL
ncbi:MAG: hypothetical protein KatS3mg088_758 [Patescibacteria group bacterium]|nr:MAG: hypothetical protein KatS3mg088_758 [Patescibacteria group bacterium]